MTRRGLDGSARLVGAGLALALFAVACAPAAPPAPTVAPTAAAKPTTAAPAAAAQPAATSAPAAQPAAASPAAASATTAPAPKPTDTKTIEFGATALTAFNWTESIADQKGFWKNYGLEVKRTLFQTDAQSTQALLGGSVNIIQATIDGVIRADTKSTADLKMVGGNVWDPNYAIVAKADLKTWKDLAGKKAAVTDLTGGSTIVLKLALKANGVDPGSITMVASGGTSNRYAALKSGTVDFTVLAQPQSFDAEADGFHVVGYSSEFIKDFQFTGYTVSEKWAKDHADEIDRFLKGLHDATLWIYDPKNKDEAVSLFAPVIKASDASLNKTWDIYFKDRANIVPKNGQPNVAGVGVVIQALADQDELTPPLPAPDQFLDLTYIKKAVPS